MRTDVSPGELAAASGIGISAVIGPLLAFGTFPIKVRFMPIQVVQVGAHLPKLFLRPAIICAATVIIWLTGIVAYGAKPPIVHGVRGDASGRYSRE